MILEIHQFKKHVQLKSKGIIIPRYYSYFAFRITQICRLAQYKMPILLVAYSAILAQFEMSIILEAYSIVALFKMPILLLTYSIVALF